MIFSSPAVLWALWALSIPIALHLFQLRRYRTVLFPDVSLLMEVKKTGQQQKRLQHWLVLLMRLIFIAAVVLAFAEPILPAANSGNENGQYVSVYVDNSMSMTRSSANGMALWSQAVQQAYAVAESYPSTTRFQLITNDFGSLQKRWLTKGEFDAALGKVRPSAQRQTLFSVQQFQAASSTEAGSSSTLYAISDFVQTIDSVFTLDSAAQFYLVHTPAAGAQNLSIDSVWSDEPFLRAGSESVIRFRLRNWSQDAAQTEVSLSANGNTQASLTVSLESNSTLDTSVSFTSMDTGFVRFTLSIADAALAFDNEYYFSMRSKASLRLVEVADEFRNDSPFAQLFKSLGFSYQFMPTQALVQDSLVGADLVVFNAPAEPILGFDQLLAWLKSVGVQALYVMPDGAGRLSHFASESVKWDTARAEAKTVKFEHPLFSDVFTEPSQTMSLPSTKGRWLLPTISDAVVAYADNQALIAHQRTDQLELYLITSPLLDKFSNFHRHSLFVPCVLNMAFAAGASAPLAYKLKPQAIKLNGRVPEMAQMTREGDSVSFVPTITPTGISVGASLSKPGHYFLKAKDGAVINSLAFNYPATESAPFTEEDQQQLSRLATHMVDAPSATELRAFISQTKAGTSLWWWFLIFAAAAVLIETILLKRFSK